MPGPQYQIIAEAPTDDFAVLERVQKGLSRTFKIDLAVQRNQLRRGGVCVGRADSLPAAQQQAELVRGIGADFRILDAQGRVVGRGEGRRGAEPPAARVDSTVRGPGFPGTPTPNRLTVDPLARTSSAPGGPIAPSTSGLDLLPTGNDALDSSAPKYNLEALESDDLVLLDGSREDAPAAKAPPPAAAPAAKPQQPISAAAFAPPVEDEVLELAEEPRRGRPAAPPVPKLPGASAPPPSPDPGPPLEDLMPTATPPPEPATAAAPPPRAAATATRPTTAAAAPRTAARLTRPARTTATRGAEEERVLFGGWFRARPRLRITVGFLAGLVLGSIAPIVHSRSVVTSRIRPQLEDLVTARAHGHILARLPNYRSPEEIEETISGIKMRTGVTTYVIWLALSGLLVFLWFRFV